MPLAPYGIGDMVRHRLLDFRELRVARRERGGVRTILSLTEHERDLP